VVFIVAPMTSSPAPLATGIDSPVIIDSSTADAPSVTTPSTGIFEPGRTTTTSPTMTSSIGISTSDAPRTTRAVLGWRPMSFSIASDVRPRAFTSIAIPSTTRAVTTTVTS